MWTINGIMIGVDYLFWPVKYFCCPLMIGKALCTVTCIPVYWNEFFPLIASMFNGYFTYQDVTALPLFLTDMFTFFLLDFTWCFCPAKVARAGFWYHQSWGTKPVFTNDSETLQKVSWTPFNWWCFSATFDNATIGVIKQQSHEKLYINNLTWLLRTIFSAKVVHKSTYSVFMAINFQNASQTMCISFTM